MEVVMKLFNSMNLELEEKDIVEVARLERKNPRNKNPAPILVCFAETWMRDECMRNKASLSNKNTEATCDYRHIYINADEDWETRRTKAMLRKIARHARDEQAVINNTQLLIKFIALTLPVVGIS